LYRRDLTYFPANLIDSTRASNLNDKQQTGPITLGTAIVGPIGIGKSLAVDNTLKLYPQVVQHTSYRGEPFPFLQLINLAEAGLPFFREHQRSYSEFLPFRGPEARYFLCTPIRRLEDGD
jgi:hypothetical protein